MLSTHKYGNWACILGAAEGLGAAFSNEMASYGFNLLLVDIKHHTLAQNAASIVEKYGAQTSTLIADLNAPESIQEIVQKTRDLKCRFIIYNAAYGPVKPFLTNESAELDRYLNVNIRSPLHIIHKILDYNPEQRTGILLVSSLAGFRGTAFVIPYAATKAFLWNLAEGIHYEFADQPVDISVTIAGTMDTPNFKATNPRSNLLIPKPMAPEHVAKITLRSFGKRLFIVPGATNRFTHFILNRILPRRWSSSLHNFVMKSMYS
jgi:hypothetical protein